MEAVTAVILLMAGANVLIMRHPEAIQLVKGMIGDLSKG
jgi:acetyl-CoA decarbonylase/synthase complex subunit delta